MFRRFVFILVLFLTTTAYGSVTGTFQWDYDCFFSIYYRDNLNSQSSVMYQAKCEDRDFYVEDTPYGYYYATFTMQGDESVPSDEILVAAYYNAIQYEYDTDGLLLYKGENVNHNALDSDTDWVITKYYYSTGVIRQLVKIRIRTTSWTNRAVGW